MITIIDYGLGNLGSIVNMYKKIGVETRITSEIDFINDSNKIILPGVGRFDAAMERIERLNIREVLNKKALIDKTPILGICLGMQLLTNGSEEGEIPGLGWIDAYAYRFNFGENTRIKVPHMGWNLVRKSTTSPLTEGFDDEFRYYFVHSYYVRVKEERNSMLKTKYEIEFDSAIQKENIFGVQFHPEKSHKFGLKLLKNFAEI